MDNEKKRARLGDIPRKQLCFDVHPDMHQRIKRVSVERNESINYWLCSVIESALILEESALGRRSSEESIDGKL